MNSALLIGSALALVALSVRLGLPRLRRRVAAEFAVAAEARSSGERPAVLPPIDRPYEDVGMRRLDLGLLLACIAVYLVTRFVGLDRFPIYFFTDEAAQAVLAFDLVHNGFSIDGELLPTFFINSEKYSLGASVYLQVLPAWLFGKSVLATRAAAVLITLPGVIALAAILGRTFRTPHPWVATGLISIAPVWFIHSRTAFETVMATSLIVVFIYFYLEYLYRTPSAIYPATAAAAIAFYTYPPARLVVLCMGLMLAIVDLPYHVRQRRVVVRALWLLLLLALPYVRFALQHPGAERFHLELINSFLVRDVAVGQKLYLVSMNYAQALNPIYWFVPNDVDLIRHVMPGAGHLPFALLPFTAIGLWRSIASFREPAHRTLLIALVAAPIGGSLAEVLVTRVLPTVMPLVLFAALGLSWTLERLEGTRLDRRRVAIVLFALFNAASLYLTRDSLVNGPTWYDDYGLYGMQFGGPEVFGRVAELRAAEPDRPIIVSPWWLNGPEMMGRFFFDDPLDVSWDGADWHVYRNDPHEPDTIFVMPANEYDWIMESGYVDSIDVIDIIHYPDGRPGFYFATIAYERADEDADVDVPVDLSEDADEGAEEDGVDDVGEVAVEDVGEDR